MKRKYRKFCYLIYFIILIYYLEEILVLNFSFQSLKMNIDFKSILNNWPYYLSGVIMIIYYLYAIFNLSIKIIEDVKYDLFKILHYFIRGIIYGIITYFIGYFFNSLFVLNFRLPLQYYHSRKLLLSFIIIYWISTFLFLSAYALFCKKKQLIKMLNANESIFKIIVTTCLTIMSIFVSISANAIYKQQLKISSKDIYPIFKINNNKHEDEYFSVKLYEIETTDDISNVSIVCNKTIYYIHEDSFIKINFNGKNSNTTTKYDYETKNFDFLINKSYYYGSVNYDTKSSNIFYSTDGNINLNKFITKCYFIIYFTDTFGIRKTQRYEVTPNDVFINEVDKEEYDAAGEITVDQKYLSDQYQLEIYLNDIIGKTKN